MAKYLVPKETFNCDLGIKLWKQSEYEVLGENPEGIALVVPVFFTKEYIKEHFDIIEK